MTEKQWLNLTNGDIIHNDKDGDMEVVWFDWYGDGEEQLCFTTDKCIYLGSQFNPDDWELKEDNE